MANNAYGSLTQSAGFNYHSPNLVSERFRCCSSISIPPKSRASRLIRMGCKLVGCGSAVPNIEFSNNELAKIVDTSHEWVYTRTGIHTRRILVGKESLTGLAVEAAQKALQMANAEPNDVDLILFCSSTPDNLFGGAPEVQKTLGCTRNPAVYDIRAACSGFLLGLVSASCHIRGGGFKNVLVIGADSVSRYVDWKDQKTCVLFGDAAGAVLVQACDSEEDGIFSFDIHTDGDGKRHLNAGINRSGTNFAVDDNGSPLGFSPTYPSISHIEMNGQEVFRFVVKAVPQSIQVSLEKADLSLSDIDWLLVHQANQRIIDRVATKLEFPKDRVISNLAHYGNTSAASIPLALDEAIQSGKVKEGQTIMTAGFGAGLTWGSAIVRWG
ncbi:beta-ketoacyl-[acyl-carrier-protein] synthase III, chloroplastic-like [Rutidosis leptorrhynchoides]|uniref:beta-ketoacyl-[acyl-carrier-protein] synthase III, chloroplastic-like n=1 Tax=Rutidosis leptorrhynchoides TaxID=125765 RepID=UPI003A99F896